MILQSPGETAFILFNIQIYWYSIIMLLAILSGIFVVCKYSQKFSLPKDFWIDNSPLLIVFGIIFARLYYCLINFDYYSSNILDVFNIRGGGLSIHGVILGGIAYLLVLAKIKKLNFYNLADSVCIALPLSQSIGRWGNFFNSEAFGIPTNNNWGLYIPIENRPAAYIQNELFHPTFLYESLLDLIIFIMLLLILKKNPKSGTIFFTYLISYSFVRIFIEQLRTDSAFNVNGIPIAQIISVLIIILCIIVLMKRKHNN